MEELQETSAASRPQNPRRVLRRVLRRNLNSKEAAVPDDGDDLGAGGDSDSGGGGGYDGVPEVGMVFKTQQEVSRFYKRYACRVGFGVSVRRSSFTKDRTCLSLDLMCCKGGRSRPEPKFRKRTVSTTGCLARIHVKLWGDGLLHLEHVCLDHNHPVSPSMARFLSHYRSGVVKKRAAGRNEDSEGGPAVGDSRLHPLPAEPDQDQVQHVDRLTELDELLFGESGRQSFIQRGRLRFLDGEAEALRLFLTRMQARNSNFFSVVDLDDEGCARSVFWADPRSRAVYQYYNDVVMLDTSYVVNRYDVPLVTFTGVNHHGQPVLLGCGLISDETAGTYVWLLKAWIACMLGELPQALITDQCEGIISAVAEVLPEVRHRFCLWQIMKKVPEQLGGLAEYRAVNKILHKAIYDSLRPEEFEEDWREMIEGYGLHNDEWLMFLYQFRHYWAPVFLKDAFWAGMSTIQHNEALNSYFDGCMNAKTTLKQFISKYEMALQSKYEKEAQADFETFHKRRPAVSKFYMEEQLSKVYTLNLFKKFQDEIEAIMYCYASVVTTGGSVSTFDVKECIFLDDGKRTMNKNYGVFYNAEEKDVQCICGSFQFRGILCRHALSVFKLQHVHEIPSKYILNRWKKDFKRLHIEARSSSNVVANNRVDRYDYLTKRCLRLVEVGVTSDKYQLALKLIREAEKFLLSDNTYEDTKPKIVSRLPKSNKPDGINNHNLGNIDQNAGKTLAAQNGRDNRRNYQLPQGKRFQGTKGILKQGGNLIALPPGSIAVPMNQHQFVGNQVGIRSVVYMFQGGVDLHTFRNPPIMPRMYQQIFQAAPQQSIVPAARQAVKKRKMYRGRKPVEAAQEPRGTSLSKG